MGIRSFFRRSESRSIAWIDPSTFLPNLPPGSSGALVAGNPEAALGVPAVYGAVRMITSAVSAMPWHARHLSDDRIVDRQPAIIRRPDPDNPLAITKEQILTSLLLHGEAFVFLTGHTRDGYPTIGIPLDNGSVKIRWNEARTRPRYYVGNSEREVRLWRDLLHIKYISEAGVLHGIGPIQAARIAVTGSLNAERMANEQWTSGGPPIDGIVTVPGKLTKEEADIHRTQWAAQGTQRGPRFLSGGMEFKGTRLTNMDLQFLESRNYGVLDVCRLFGIPPKFLMAELGGSSLSYANNQESYTDLVRNAYQPVADKLEVAFGEAIPSTQFVDTDFGSLFRADVRTRFDTYAIARQNGILTVNEIRERERLAPIAGGDVSTAPETSIDVDVETDEGIPA
jgi:HK97 family phage portal protein